MKQGSECGFLKVDDSRISFALKLVENAQDYFFILLLSQFLEILFQELFQRIACVCV